ncbi:hypothetical protein BDV26DRAFT_97729 [Aspergillus bertholletiae]|uniref:Uncharacterized protein n=1 Tax=Aspergillus bertholletiae TaxID=1226010 RepID=A0A5N7ATA5_9EURO|nr:hypothetical protein BDV26DRAFT_97729 [Aspergillus bertholletiae]
MPWLSSCSDLPRPTVSVDSVTKAEYELRSFFEDENTNYDLRLRISEAILDSKPVTSILRSAQKRKRLFIYDHEANVLRAYPAMPRPIHNTVTDLVSQFLMKAVRTNFITEDEQGCISSSTEGILLSRMQTHTSGKKHQGWIKYPEITILFRELDGRSLPRVVFEVGFSESYDDLQNDARQWLIRSRGLVRLVILVRIDEDVR